MAEIVYNDIEIRAFGKHYTKIPLTFNGAGEVAIGTVIGETKDAAKTVKVYAAGDRAIGILAEPINDTGEPVTSNVYVCGMFTSSLIKGLDAAAKTDLGAREVAGILIVPGC